jgi:hypothetical protein
MKTSLNQARQQHTGAEFSCPKFLKGMWDILQSSLFCSAAPLRALRDVGGVMQDGIVTTMSFQDNSRNSVFEKQAKFPKRCFFSRKYARSFETFPL